MTKRAKLTIIGAGNIGATAARIAAQRALADVVLVDIVEGLPQGKALDLMQAGPIEGFDATITGTNDYAPTAGSDVIIVTSGVPRKPGMSRDDLLGINAKIVKDVVSQAAKASPDAVLVVVANPLDAMTYVAHRVSGYPAQRVMGMAGILDSARFRTFLAMELGVSAACITATVLGGHGDTMVPLTRYTTVAGVPVEKCIPKARLDAIVERTRNGGAEIVGLLKTGSAFQAPAAAAIEMAESVLLDRKKILPCAAYCKGEYGVKGLFVGVPSRLGRKGVEEVVEIDLTAKEKKALGKSVDAVRGLCADVDRLMGWKKKAK